MFSILINNITVFFSKFFAASDREAVVKAVKDTGAKRVVFIDTPATGELVATVRELMDAGVAVVVRDHHDVAGEPRIDRDRAIRAAVEDLRELVGDACGISNRQIDPACSSLVAEGEFVESGTVIVADPDPDGLTAAMKALGIVYPELDSDAAVLDGPRKEQTAEQLSPSAMLLVKGMATLPPFDKNRPEVAENAKGKLFADFVAMVSGDAEAKASFEAKVEAYEAGVAEAEKISAEATEPASGVWLVDAVGRPRFNLQTLIERLEGRDGCRVTVVRKDNGPIAAAQGGVQYSLAVPRPLQGEVNLQVLLPAGFTSSPEAGIISNTTFLLHCSEQVWDSQVLPALQAAK